MKKIQDIIFTFLDIFYPLFNRFFDKQTFHYLACGGGNTALGLVLYFIFYHFGINKQNVNLGIIILTPHIASFFFSFLITFPIGFILSKYVVWNESSLPGKDQFKRHFSFVVLSVFMNYGLLKLFVDYFNWWAMPSQVLTTIIIVIVSYVTQKHYSFKS